MERTLIAIDAVTLHKEALGFACYLAAANNSKLTGVFLENLAADEKLVVHEMYGYKYVDWSVDTESPVYKVKMEAIQRNIQQFEEFCKQQAVPYVTLRCAGNPAAELISESRYADLIITDADTSFGHGSETAPSAFVRKLLKETYCPVIIAPERFSDIDEIIFTWDGSDASTYAIRQFSYLFPSFSEKKVRVLTIDETHTHMDRQDASRFTEWLAAHFPKAEQVVIKGDAETELLAELYKKEKLFIVLGAYGRSDISRLFKRSHADILIKTMTQPIFIAHQR